MDDTDYALGRTNAEYDRLIEQADLFRPLTERLLRATSVPSCAARSDGGAVSARPRITCTHGQNAGAPSPSNARPHKTSEPRSAASPATRSAMRVLPMPGSPERRKSEPRPFSAASTAARSSPTSRSRPTNTPPASRSVANRLASRSALSARASPANSLIPNPSVGARRRDCPPWFPFGPSEAAGEGDSRFDSCPARPFPISAGNERSSSPGSGGRVRRRRPCRYAPWSRGSEPPPGGRPRSSGGPPRSVASR